MRLTFEATHSPADRDAVAQLWAETTAARDGRDEVAPLDASRPVIDAVLDGSPRSVLLVGRDDGEVVAFAGWSADGDPAPHPHTGKPEQRYTLDL